MSIRHPTEAPSTTLLSQKGQVVIPKTIREARGWQPGLRLVIEPSPGGLSLRPLDATRAETASALLGCTCYRGPRRSLAEMETAIRAGARKAR